MTTPVQQVSGLVVGTVESVSPNEIRVLLELDAPGATALNTGTPSSFPRLNGYVLIPNEAGGTVGFISWIGIERSPYPKRSGLKDFGVINLPFPLRKMAISPVGTLTSSREIGSSKLSYELVRGVMAFPSVGDQVLLPTPDQITAIVCGRDTDKRVEIGTSALAANAKIRVDPDKIFGRHLAVLGNTGSGKSCSVAGLIRWSIAAANRQRTLDNASPVPNQRFIVLDPNGEYSKAFEDMGSRCRIFKVPPLTGNIRPLQVPAWMWDGHEWSCVAHAQPGAQRPLLMQALRDLRAGHLTSLPRETQIRRYLATYSTRLSSMLANPNSFVGSAANRFACARLLEVIAAGCLNFSTELANVGQDGALQALSQQTSAILQSRRSFNPQFFDDFHIHNLETVRSGLGAIVDALPDDHPQEPVSEDTPVHFRVSDLPEHLNQIAIDQGGNVAGFISTLELRLRSMLADRRLGPIIDQEQPPDFGGWLGDYIGTNGAANGEVAIIDLSLVPSDVTHIVVAVLGRLMFEGLQRYRRVTGQALPTVLVLEEAHTFVRRSNERDTDTATPQHLCREAFERIAREGRKFGLGLVLSSQRPSELSPTVLAQCNTFLLHRIVNDLDQDLVARLVPDNLAGLLRELPSLPSRQAILLGWATPIPVLVEITELPESQRPNSKDPDFWDVWTGQEERPIDWSAIAADWGVAQVPAAVTSGAESAESRPNSGTAPPALDASESDDVPF